MSFWTRFSLCFWEGCKLGPTNVCEEIQPNNLLIVTAYRSARGSAGAAMLVCKSSLKDQFDGSYLALPTVFAQVARPWQGP
jgi:hypothetical protein